MFTDWLAKLGAWGLTGLAAMFLLEGAGVPLPPEIPLIIAGGLAHAGHYPFWLLVFVAWGATVAGNLMGYGLGYVGGRPLATRAMTWAGISAERICRAERWIQNHGLKILFCFRWINWGFPMGLWLAGAGRLPWTRLVPWMLILNLAWAVTWIWLGSLIARHLARVGALDWVLMLGGLVVLVATLVWWRRRRTA